MIAGGASLAPRRWSLPAEAIEARSTYGGIWIDNTGAVETGGVAPDCWLRVTPSSGRAGQTELTLMALQSGENPRRLAGRRERHRLVKDVALRVFDHFALPLTVLARQEIEARGPRIGGRLPFDQLELREGQEQPLRQ